MKVAVTWGRAVGLGVAAALVGFGLGRSGAPDSVGGQDMPIPAEAIAIPATPPSSPSLPAVTAPPLPVPESTDASGLADFIKDLEARGISRDLAQWLAIREALRLDRPGSFAFAQAEGAGSVWAVAVAMVDPVGGFEAVRTLKGPTIYAAMDVANATAGFFATLGRTDPELGWDLIGKLAPLEAQSVVGPFFESWAALAPSAAREGAAGIDSKIMRHIAHWGIFREWGRRDRPGLLRWAEGQDRRTQQTAWQSTWEFGGIREPEALLELTGASSHQPDFGMVSQIADALAERGVGVLPIVQRLPDGPTRTMAMRSLGRNLTQSNPAAALEIARLLDPEERSEFLDVFALREIAKIAPAEAAAYATEGDYPTYGGVADVVQTWSEADAPAAFAWTLANLRGGDREQAIEATLRNWAEADPARAVDALDRLPPGERARALTPALMAWASEDPRAALGYAQDLEPLARTRAVNGALQGWASTDPVGAAEQLDALPVDGMGGAYDLVAWRWSDRAPLETAKWAETIPSSEMSGRVVDKILRKWGVQDASAASNYVSELAPGPYRDQAAAGLVRSIRDLDPASAEKWAETVGKRELRERLLRELKERENR